MTDNQDDFSDDELPDETRTEEVRTIKTRPATPLDELKRYAKKYDEELAIIFFVLLVLFGWSSIPPEWIKWGIYSLGALAALILLGLLYLALWLIGSLVYLVEKEIDRLQMQELRELYELNKQELVEFGALQEGKLGQLLDLFSWEYKAPYKWSHLEYDAKKEEHIEYEKIRVRLKPDHDPPNWNYLRVPSDWALVRRGAAAAVIVAVGVVSLRLLINSIS